MPTVAADGIYYVDLGDDPLFSGGSFISIFPESLTFDDQIRGVGNCSWQISFAAEDQDQNPIITGHDPFHPYGTYYRLRYGDVAIQAGILASWGTKLGDDFASFAGKTWEHYLERWQYPFNPAGPNIYRFPNSFVGNELSGSGTPTPTGLAYQASNRDVILILSDLLSTTMNVGNRVIFDISALAGTAGVTTNYQFSLGDTTYMSGLVGDLSEIGEGFDWWISHDMQFLWASPYRFGNPSAPAITFTVDDTNPPDSLEFQNFGPIATHILGQGAGLAPSSTLAIALGAPASEAAFTRLDTSESMGDVRNADALSLATRKKFSYDLNPQHTIPITLSPDRITDFWSTFRKGRAIHIDYDLIAHGINSDHQLVSYECSVTKEGQASVDFTLSQLYDVSSSVGIIEG